MAKPSTLITTVEQAMTSVPKLLVRDCTTRAAIENTAWVNPEGSPSLVSSATILRSGLSVCRFSVIVSFILRRRSMHSSADTACAMMVAQATPATPIRNTATNSRSSTMFSPQATRRNTKGITESPSPLKIPDIIL